MSEPVVVDTNVLFSALLRKGARFTEVLLTSDRRFLRIGLHADYERLLTQL